MSELFKPLDCNTVKLTEEQRKYIAKCYLNAQYGAMIYADTDSVKEIKKMKREYIVVHNDNHKTGVIFKDKIIGVFDEMEGDVEETRIVVEGNVIYVMDKYAEIVKQLI